MRSPELPPDVCSVIPVTKNLGLVHTGYEILEEIKKGVK